MTAVMVMMVLMMMTMTMMVATMTLIVIPTGRLEARWADVPGAAAGDQGHGQAQHVAFVSQNEGARQTHRFQNVQRGCYHAVRFFQHSFVTAVLFFSRSAAHFRYRNTK